MEQEQRQEAKQCPKNCKMCSMAQQVYCAAQLSFTSFDVMSKMFERFDAIEERIAEVESSIHSMKGDVDIDMMVQS